MEPAEWEEMAPALAESPGNGREIHPETGDAALGIDEEAGYAVVEHRDDLVGFLPNLLIGERDEIVNALLETAVVDVEKGLHLLPVLLESVNVQFPEGVAFQQALPHPYEFLRHLFRHTHLVLQPVTFLYVAQSCKEVIVVGIVVEAIEGRDILKALHKHTLLAQGVVVKRSVDLVHTPFRSPFFGPAYEQRGHFEVIHHVKPAETGPAGAVDFVVARVYHCADSAHDPFPVEGQPHSPFAVTEGAAGSKRLPLVRIQRRDILGAVPVEIQREADEAPEIAPVLYFFQFVSAHNPQRYELSAKRRGTKAHAPWLHPIFRPSGQESYH